jgi:hypothetical protein
MGRRKSKEQVEMGDEATQMQTEDEASEAEGKPLESVDVDSYHEESPVPASHPSALVTPPATTSEGGEPAYPYEYRSAPRKPAAVKAVVQIREDDGNTWKEIIEIQTVSKNGAALLLSKECPVGRLVSLALQMPAEMRAYDFYSDVYAMLAVVQNCSPVTINDKIAYHIGVAFIGKKMPDSFKENPSQTYRIVGMSSQGLWTVTEAARKFINRKSTRFWRRFEVAVSLRDQESRSTKRQMAMTRDVSLGGMSVWGPLEAKIGDRVKISSKEHDFFGMAIVRNRTEHDDDTKTMIHFEFDGMEFPIARIRDEAIHETEAPATDGSNPS